MDSILSLEIAEDKIKILKLAATEAGPKLICCDNLELPQGCIKEGIIIKPNLVAETLSNFIKDNKKTGIQGKTEYSKYKRKGE